MICYCAQTRHAARLLTALYEDALRPSGLTPSQFELLTTLHHTGPVAQAPLVAGMALDATTLSRNIKPLLARGLLTRSKSRHDARETLYVLSPAGEALRATAHPLWQRAHKLIQRRLGPAAQPSMVALKALQQAATTA